MMPETLADKYRREAEACRLKAEEATNSVDKQAWQQLAAERPGNCAYRRC
jgi:hypothetical protein